MSNLIVRILAQNMTGKGFAGATASSQKFKASIQRTTAALGRMSIVAASIGVIGLKKFAEFDTKVREIGTLLGDVTDGELKRMKKEVEAMSIKFGQSVDKMAKAKYDIISAGFTEASESAKLLDVSARLASAGVTEVSKTADVLTSILNAYGKSANDAEHFSDILFTTVRLGKTTVDELASGLGRAAAIAPQVGVSFEELAAATATLTAGGQSTDEVVTALTATMSTFLKTPPELTQRLEDLGFASGKAALEQKGLGGALEALTQNMTETEIAAFFPNIRALRAVFPITGSLAQKFSSNIEEMGNVAGATDKAFKIVAEGIEFRLKQLGQRAEAILRNFGAWAADVVDAFLKWDNASKNLAISIGLLVIAIKLLGLPIALIITAAYAFYQAWDKNIFGVRELITKFAEEVRTTFNALLIYIENIAQIVSKAISGEWATIGLNVALIQQGIEQETEAHTERMLQINSDFANAYVGTLNDLVPDVAKHLFDLPKLEEKSAEAVETVSKGFYEPDLENRMSFGARAAEEEARMTRDVNKLRLQQGRTTSMQEYQMWNRNWQRIGQSVIATFGNVIVPFIAQAFETMFGQGKTWFGKLWRTVLSQFISMIASMTARWLAFKALTSLGFGGFFFSRGGIVGEGIPLKKMQRAQTGMISAGFDTEPALLRRGEAVIPAERTRENMPAIRQIMAGQTPSLDAAGGGGRNIQVITNINAIDTQGVKEFVESEDFRRTIIEAINDNKIDLRYNFTGGGLQEKNIEGFI